MPGGKVRLKEAGAIRTDAKERYTDRLHKLRAGLQELVRKWSPETASVESLFFTKNAKTAIKVAEARGVILLTLADAGLDIAEYSPTEVKRTLTGSGTADKAQVRKMVRLVLDLKEVPGLDDVTDAIAIAWCRCFRSLAGRK